MKRAVTAILAALLLAFALLLSYAASDIFGDVLHWRANATVYPLTTRDNYPPINFLQPHWEVVLNNGFYDYTNTFLKNSRNILFCGRGEDADCAEQGTRQNWTRFFYMGVKTQSRPYTAASSNAVLYRVDLATPATDPPTWVPIVPGSDGYITGSVSSADLPSSARDVGVIFALIFPTHPTQFDLTVASVSNQAACDLYQKIPDTSPVSGNTMGGWQVRNPATGGAFQDISSSNCNMARDGDWTFKMDPERLTIDSFASIVDVPVDSRSNASTLFGRHAVYLALKPISKNAGNFKFRVGDWESGISYLTASTLKPPGGGYDITAYPQSTAESSIGMAGELQAPIGEWTDNSSTAVEGLPDDSVCIAMRTLWPSYVESGGGIGNMHIFGVTKRGDVAPYLRSRSTFGTSNWAVQMSVQTNVTRTFRLRINSYYSIVGGRTAIDIPRGGETSALIVLIKTGDSLRVQVFDFDYHHPTLGSGGVGEGGYCAAVAVDPSDPEFYADRTFASSVPFGMTDESYFTMMRYGDFGFSTLDEQGKGLSYRYPLWTQITMNLPGETTPRIDLRPWILDCKVTGSAAPYALNKCGAPETVSHFIPVAQWRSNRVPEHQSLPRGRLHKSLGLGDAGDR